MSRVRTPIRTEHPRLGIEMRNALRRWIATSVLMAASLAACGDNGTDPQPLTAPIGLTGTAGSQQVTISWTAVEDADAYTVQRATAAGTFADAGTTQTASY